MQYNHTVEIQFAENWDDYGQPATVTTKSLRCRILNESITNQKTDTKQKNQYDMTLIVGARAYSPYSRLFEDSQIIIIRNDRQYDVSRITQVNGFSGSAKFYEISLNQKVAK